MSRTRKDLRKNQIHSKYFAPKGIRFLKKRVKRLNNKKIRKSEEEFNNSDYKRANPDWKWLM